MVEDCAPNAPIVFTPSRANEMRISEQDRNRLKRQYPSMKDVISVDSEDGTGINALKRVLVEKATSAPLVQHTVCELLSSHEDLYRVILAHAKEDRFSLTVAEVNDLGTSQVGIDAASIKLAVEIFCAWGLFHRLSNEDLVIKPQQLANVMACVFTGSPQSKERIGQDVSNGVLRHEDTTLRKIWGDYPSNLWSCSKADPEYVPPFLDLLHRSKLAYPLYDQQGAAIGATLIPSLLPMIPSGMDKEKWFDLSEIKDQNERILAIGTELYHLLVPSHMPLLSTLVLEPSVLPTTFLGHIQVALQSMIQIGGSWRSGCCLVLQGNSAVSSSSYAILFVDEKAGLEKLVLVSTGGSSSAQIIVLNT